LYNGETIDHLLFISMDNLKLFANNEKNLESLVQTIRILVT